MQRELTESGPLLDSAGRLLERGWARAPVRAYDRSAVAPGWWRIKEWDYYAVLNSSCGVAVTVADIGYLGLLSASWLDFEAGTVVSDSRVVPLPRGRFGMPPDPDEGAVRLERRGVRVSFVPTAAGRAIQFEFPGFDGGRGLAVDLTLERAPDDDRVVIVHDWAKNRQRFYYNVKDPALPARGTVTVGDRTEQLGDAALGVHDWGRGAWPYTSTWYWGAAGTWHDGVRLGWNLGYGFGDREQASENAIVYDGTVHKLADVDFHFGEYEDTWEITSSDGRLEMDFEPLFDRAESINLGLLATTQHQVFGHYSGTLVLDDGTTLTVEDVIGFAEEVRNRW